MGRRKIEIKMVKEKSPRQVTFSKRRTGLFKQANELATMYGAEVAIAVFSPDGKPFSSGNPSIENNTKRFLNENFDKKSGGGHDSGSSSKNHRKIRKLNKQYEDLTKQLQMEEKNGEMLEKALEQNKLKCKMLIDEHDFSELQKLKGKWEELRDFVKMHMSEIEASSSLLLLVEKPISM